MADMDGLGLKTFLQPGQLSRPETVARELEAMDQVEARNEAYLQELGDALQEFIAGGSQLSAGASGRSNRLQQDIDTELGFQRKYAACNRAMLGTIRRVLVFADQRRDKLQMGDGKLMLPSKEELAIYNAYIAQLGQQKAAVDELIARQVQQRESRIKPAP